MKSAWFCDFYGKNRKIRTVSIVFNNFLKFMKNIGKNQKFTINYKLIYAIYCLFAKTKKKIFIMVYFCFISIRKIKYIMKVKDKKSFDELYNYDLFHLTEIADVYEAYKTTIDRLLKATLELLKTFSIVDICLTNISPLTLI